MAWFDRKRRLLDALARRGYVRSPSVWDAMDSVPRHQFVPDALARSAYKDTPLPIGHEQTISAPHMVAIMLEALRIQAGQSVLEIGTGSGYHAAVISRLVGPGGRVVTIETIDALAAAAHERLQSLGIRNVTVRAADGAEGAADEAPFDRISVACATIDVPPKLLEQLADSGCMVIPVGPKPSRLLRLTKTGDRVRREDLGPCAFVPMTHRKNEAPS